MQLIDFDESGTSSDVPIPFIVVSPLARANYSNSIFYTHSSLLRTIEEGFGVQSFLRYAANATDLSDLFRSGTIP